MRNLFVKALCVLALLAFARPRRATAQDITPLNGLNDKIAHIIKSDAQPGEVQVTTIPAVVDWNRDGGRYQFYQLCDNLSKWGPEISLTGTSVSEMYSHFLIGIQAPAGDALADKTQRDLAKEANQYFNQRQAVRRRVLKEWNDLVASEQNVREDQRTAYTTFMRGQSQLASLDISFRSALSRWQPYAAAAAPSSVGYNLNAFMSDGAQVKVKTYSGAEVNVYPCEPGIDITSALESAKTYTGPPDLDLEFGHHTAQHNESWETWGGSGGWGPFSVDVHGSRHDVHNADTNFHLKFEAARVIHMAVSRNWLNFTLIHTYKDAAPYPNSDLMRDLPLWGDQGSFPLVSREFVIAYHPRVSVTMSSSDYASEKKDFSAGGSLSVGPFHVGANGSGGSVVEKWDDQNSTVVIGTGVDSFVLLGVVNRIMP
jgi:hypothetical protein